MFQYFKVFVGDYCYEKGIYFIVVEIVGLFVNIFCDFGNNFIVFDFSGENFVSGIVVGIDEEGLVFVFDEMWYGLEDGDYVMFIEVEGMEGFNGVEF